MMYLSAAFILLWSAAVSYVIWNSAHRPGERLWHVAMGLGLAGPLPFAALWMDAYTSFNLDASMSGPEAFWAVIGFCLYLIVPAIIGEIFKW